MRKLASLTRGLFYAVALCVLCGSCWAQANIRTVLLIKVKLDQEDSWKSSVKDYVALMKKAGSEQAFTTWESQTGPHLHAVVWYSAKWKDMGEENPKLKSSGADLASLFARLNTETDSLETWIDELQPDMAIPVKEMPAMVRTGRTRVVSGKMEDIKAIFHEQIVPAVKKSGATGYGVFLPRFGTPTNEIHSFISLSGWGDLDGPIGAEKGMTAAEFKAFQAKIAPLIEGTEWTIWKYEADLSYLPAASK